MDFEQEIRELKERNERVDSDKRWETSVARRLLVALLVFCAAWAWLFIQGSETALRDALFPPCGYLLSTTALSFFRVQWEARHQKQL